MTREFSGDRSIGLMQRKTLVVANEAGIEDQLEKVDCSTTTPVNPDPSNANPLKKIPALELDDGTILFDSPVICEYLDTELGNGSLFPRQLSARWTALRFQALADGLLDAAILVRYETILRPENLYWDDGQFGLWPQGNINRRRIGIVCR